MIKNQVSIIYCYQPSREFEDDKKGNIILQLTVYKFTIYKKLFSKH